MVPGHTMVEAKLCLANEEHKREGYASNAPHTPSTFLTLALELEAL